MGNGKRKVKGERGNRLNDQVRECIVLAFEEETGGYGNWEKENSGKKRRQKTCKGLE